MAIAASLAAQMQRTASALISARIGRLATMPKETAGLSVESLKQDLRNVFGSNPLVDGRAIDSQARVALRQYKLAQQLNDDPTRRIPISYLPSDAALTGSVNRVRYEILVRGFDQYGQEKTFRTSIESPTAMSAQEIQEYALAHLSELPVFHRANTTNLDTSGAHPLPTVRVLTAGRQP